DDLHAGTTEHVEDLIGALPAEREIGSLDAGTVRVADDIHCDCSAEALGLDDQGLEILFTLTECRLLARLELGAPQREDQNGRFERGFKAIELYPFRILQVGDVNRIHACNPWCAFLEMSNPFGWRDALRPELTILFGESDARGRMQQLLRAPEDDDIVH